MRLLLFDLGVMVNGYASDMTRTVAVGNQTNSRRMLQRLEAQQAALTLSSLVSQPIEVDAQLVK